MEFGTPLTMRTLLDNDIKPGTWIHVTQMLTRQQTFIEEEDTFSGDYDAIITRIEWVFNKFSVKPDPLETTIIVTRYDDEGERKEREYSLSNTGPSQTVTFHKIQRPEYLKLRKITCAECGEIAKFKCKCETEWYCSKACQIIQWRAGHKDKCSS